MDSLMRTIEENCVGCNKCILSCPVDDANISYVIGNINKVHINAERCIMCGKCLDICDHNARDFKDDTESFIEDLKKGINIAVIAAPSTKLNFKNYKRLIGFLKSIGIKKAFDVSFGADITTWAYLKVLKEENFESIISQPCPAIVNYIQKYEHSLLEKLAPIQSPAMSLGIYLKKYKKNEARLCFLSPCVAKTSEIRDENAPRYISYNVTFRKLKEYIASHGIDLDKYEEEELEFPADGLGDTYSSPGGLSENIRLYDKSLWIKQVEGVESVYRYINEYSRRSSRKQSLPRLVDALNCPGGCNIGTAACRDVDITDIDEVANTLKQKKLNSRVEKEVEKIAGLFDKELNINDFKRNYTAEDIIESKEPSDEEYNQIFNDMEKKAGDSRSINCNSCGYRSCHHMAKAIFNGFNHKENCIYYSSKMAMKKLELEQRNEAIEVLLEEVLLKSKELFEANERLKELDKIKSDFISTVSHELRTPLTSVMGFAKIIKKKFEDVIVGEIKTEDKKIIRTIGQVQDNLDIIVSEGERLTILINDVLDIAKMEAGKTEWKTEQLSVMEIVDRATAATFALFEQKGLKLNKYVEENLPEIMGDRDRLIQVIINLISNAVKFTDTGTVTCEAVLENGMVKISVADTGIGIAEKDIPQVFEKFKQVGDTLTDKPKGTGLGLPICKQIVEHHGGNISVESTLGRGSVFSFSIPAIKESLAQEARTVKDNVVKKLKEHVATTIPVDAGSKRILVVDDEESIRKLLRQEFEDEGYYVEEAKDGIEAIDMIKAAVPDVIILDVMMPMMNGFDVAAVIKNDPRTKNIPIIILSIVEDRERGFNIGVDRYLTKPININELMKEVELLISYGRTRKKVLVVNEDEPTIKTLTSVLESKGFIVAEARTYDEYVEKMEAVKPNMIFVDSKFAASHQISRTLKFQKDLEEVLIVVYSDPDNLPL
ncbi:MAG: [Fe-Fe] hydrogenase large subunit C-terminal domain-containing protein [Bacillota bacterium]|nr:[Fe-Fe] hydrogenase large subunit C-terminal domain-containing protein [Bacillota bacterium]